MIVVITGGCGFVGLNLVRGLLETGVKRIRVLDNLATGQHAHLACLLTAGNGFAARLVSENIWSLQTRSGETTVELHIADVRDDRATNSVCAGATAVVHLAAQTGVQVSLKDPAADIHQNVIGTFNVLEACRHNGVRRLILASSAAASGAGAPPQREDDACRPLSPYGAGKAAAEAYCSAYHRSFGIETLPLRFSNLYGPFAWHKGSVVATFCKRGLSGKPLIVEGDGLQTRDFVFSTDLVGVIIRAITMNGATPSGLFGQPLNVASGVQTTIRDLAVSTRALLCKAGYGCEIAGGPPREGDVRISAPDTSRMRKFFPDIAMRGLDEGLAQTVEWFVRSWMREDA